MPTSAVSHTSVLSAAAWGHTSTPDARRLAADSGMGSSPPPTQPPLPSPPPAPAPPAGVLASSASGLSPRGSASGPPAAVARAEAQKEKAGGATSPGSGREEPRRTQCSRSTLTTPPPRSLHLPPPLQHYSAAAATAPGRLVPIAPARTPATPAPTITTATATSPALEVLAARPASRVTTHGSCIRACRGAICRPVAHHIPHASRRGTVHHDEWGG
jgi:hypothetical protein